MEVIAIKTCDENLFVTYDNITNDTGLTNNIMNRNLATFTSVEDAKEFAKCYLNDEDTCDIVKLKINATEILVGTINY